MPEFDESFYDRMSKFDVPFVDYFETMGGKSVKVEQDELIILGENDVRLGKLCVGKSAKKAGLQLEKLLNREHKEGEDNYGVLLNGYNRRDWLFAVKYVIEI